MSYQGAAAVPEGGIFENKLPEGPHGLVPFGPMALCAIGKKRQVLVGRQTGAS